MHNLRVTVHQLQNHGQRSNPGKYAWPLAIQNGPGAVAIHPVISQMGVLNRKQKQITAFIGLVLVGSQSEKARNGGLMLRKRGTFPVYRQQNR